MILCGGEKITLVLDIFSSRAGAWLLILAWYGPGFFSARIMCKNKTKHVYYISVDSNNINVIYSESILPSNSHWSSVCSLDCPNIFII